MQTKNNLWKARKRAGFERKQVARLLSHKSVDVISRYEKGEYPPSIKTALKLEIIYQTPIRLLFQDLFEECRKEIKRNWKKHSLIMPDSHWFPDHIEGLKFEEHCFYAELLKKGKPNEYEWEEISKHTRNLMNTLSDYRQGRKPFSLT